MQRINESSRVKTLEERWHVPLPKLFYDWHWRDNLKHQEIAERIGLPRPTVTRWFRCFRIPTQSGTRFTNFNLLNVGPRKSPPAKPKVKRESPWKWNKEFFKTWSPEMAYVLGFLCADGAVYKNPRGSYYFAFYSADREIVSKIRSVLQSNHKIGVREKSKYNAHWRTSYVLQIGGKHAFDDLKQLGIVPDKSLRMLFPRVPRAFVGHFVRGYFDGDGSVCFRQYWAKDRQKMRWIFQLRFISGSRRFLKGLRQALLPYITGGYIYEKSGSGYDLAFSHRDARALFHLMYDEAPKRLFLERKYRTFLKAMKILRPTGT